MASVTYFWAKKLTPHLFLLEVTTQIKIEKFDAGSNIMVGPPPGRTGSEVPC